MLELRNKTPFEAVIAPAMDKNCNEFIVVVVKATYNIVNNSDNLSFTEGQTPIVMADEYYFEPETSSIKHAADTAMSKIGTDVLLQGQAYNLQGASFVDTFVSVGNVTKQIRVFGNRYWEKNFGGWKISTPEKFETMSMTFENAYGGIEQTDQQEAKRFEQKNPVGKGFYQKQDKRALEGFPLPNLEDPRQLITHWRDSTNPATYAPVAPHWAPRKAMAGTYDNQWEKQRKPFLPLDFDENYFNVAPRDMITTRPLQGEERVEFNHLSPMGHARFFLPKPNFKIRYAMKRSSHDAPPCSLDTVVIRPDQNVLTLTWRTKIPCNRQFLYCDWVSLKMVS